MSNNEDLNVSPASDGYKLMPVFTKYYLLTIIISVIALNYLPHEYTVCRLLAFGAQMLLAGIIIGNQATIWSRPKLERVRSSKD